MTPETSNYTQPLPNDVIDIRELFAILGRRKKLIWSITALVTLLALVYAFTVTPWWQVNATLEIGKFTDSKTGEESYLEDGAGVAERLKVQHIDIYKHTKGRNTKIESITPSKNNPQFITVTALGKNNDLALSEIQKVISNLQNRHQKIIEEIIAKKQSGLDGIERNIFQIKQYKMKNITDRIDYIKTVRLPAVDQKIATVKADLKNSKQQKEEALKNLTSLNNNAALAALRLAQIQGLEYKISGNEMKLINLHSEKQQILATTLPSLKRQLDELKNISLAKLQEEYNLTKLSMQPHNYHNTQVIGNIITQENPVKPKKKLIVIVAFITGLMLSVFLAFFLEFMQGLKRED
jgi:uncharacterized protein involved in exopolysaccharide biosynthesis